MSARKLPAGSLNHAIVGPFPRAIPFASVWSGPAPYRSKRTPFAVSSSTSFSTSSTGKLRIVNVAGTWFGFGYARMSLLLGVWIGSILHGDRDAIRCAQEEREEADEDPNFAQVLVEVVDRGSVLRLHRARVAEELVHGRELLRCEPEIGDRLADRDHDGDALERDAERVRALQRCGELRSAGLTHGAKRLRGGPDVAGLVEDRGDRGRQIPAARERLEPDDRALEPAERFAEDAIAAGRQMRFEKHLPLRQLAG